VRWKQGLEDDDLGMTEVVNVFWFSKIGMPKDFPQILVTRGFG
jgi:hypothetical protein